MVLLLLLVWVVQVECGELTIGTDIEFVDRSLTRLFRTFTGTSTTDSVIIRAFFASFGAIITFRSDTITPDCQLRPGPRRI